MEEVTHEDYVKRKKYEKCSGDKSEMGVRGREGKKNTRKHKSGGGGLVRCEGSITSGHGGGNDYNGTESNTKL